MQKNNPDKQYLDYHYREMVRLSNVHTTYIKSAFSDFKLLGAAGLMVAWAPLSETLVEGHDPKVMLLGFVAIFFVIIVTTLFDLMKQSIMLYYLEQIRHFENAIRDKLDIHDEETFKVAHNWPRWSKNVHEHIAWRFFAVLYIFVIAFPATVLLGHGYEWHAVIFLVIALLLLSIHITAVRLIVKAVE
ncbi:MAG: hypothetical protein OER96_04320 [Gammaproteobacteria bacterium]|nr:hypothetical protein [Gammaproteobacteria bacterium]